MDTTYQAPKKPIYIYVVHIGGGFEDRLDKENNETVSVIHGDDNEPSQWTPDPEPTHMFYVGLEDEINKEIVLL